MKVKRYEGKSEAAIMEIIHEEMGSNATIINVKEKPATGLFKFLFKPSIVITAACEDDTEFFDLMAKAEAEEKFETPHVERKPINADLIGNTQSSGVVGLEESMSILLQEARKAANQIETEEAEKRSVKSSIEASKTASIDELSANENKKYKHSMVQLFYDTMLAQEVRPDVATHILRELEGIDESSQVDVKLLIKAVYGNIVDILKNPTLIDTNKGLLQTIVFMGPTGVGKTTTIAKLSSILALKHGLKVGLITADTYRIAAVEQLKTYADILGLDIRVVYNASEMSEHLRSLKAKNDIVLIDTAGRSHRNQESLNELKTLVDNIPDSKRYLVLSVTTRYKDLCKIVSTYDQISDFNLIFTKLDEAETLGSLMNICCLAGKKAAYVTFGQNVPDDLEAIKPDKIAKSLLGLTDGGIHPYSEGGGPS